VFEQLFILVITMATDLKKWANASGNVDYLLRLTHW